MGQVTAGRGGCLAQRQLPGMLGRLCVWNHCCRCCTHCRDTAAEGCSKALHLSLLPGSAWPPGSLAACRCLQHQSLPFSDRWPNFKPHKRLKRTLGQYKATCTVCVCVCMHACVCACVHACTCVCVCVCVGGGEGVTVRAGLFLCFNNPPNFDLNYRISNVRM